MTKPKGVFKRRKNVGVPKKPLVQAVGLGLLNTPDIGFGDLPNRPSSSKQKIEDTRLSYSEYDNQSVLDIVNIESLLSSVLDISACKSCGAELSYIINRLGGLATNCELKCKSCDSKVLYSNSNLTKGTHLYDINTRLVYGLRTIGKGQSSAKTLCAILNLPPPPAKFDRYNEVIAKATKDVCKKVMKEAVEKAVLENNGCRDLTVAVDGTWQKRGHTSNNGVVTITSVDTGCVLDVAVISKFCYCKDKLLGVHAENCKANFIGTSGAMEVHGAIEIFHRSEPEYGVKYKHYLGDGDSSAFSSVNDSRPYGDGYVIEKMECCGHVQKRMGSRLKKIKQKFGKTNLSDGKTIGGRNRLTDERILFIQKCYGLAIKRTAKPGSNLNKMRTAVWATYFHLLSSNEKPQHGLCDRGELSWCKYQRAVAKGESYDHNKHTHISEVVMLEIKNIFRDLSNPDLLKKCLHGKSQNPNESVNAVIWSRLPKTVFVGMQTMEAGVYDAVLSFNKGNVTRCLVLKELGATVSQNTSAVFSEMDRLRVQRGERMLSYLMKKARQRRESAKRKLEEALADEEDPDQPAYGAGMH